MHIKTNMRKLLAQFVRWKRFAGYVSTEGVFVLMVGVFVLFCNRCTHMHAHACTCTHIHIRIHTHASL